MKKPYVSALATILVLVLYVLSVGPVSKSVFVPGKTPIVSYSVYEKLYAPLGWLCGKSSAMNKVTDWYIRLYWTEDDI